MRLRAPGGATATSAAALAVASRDVCYADKSLSFGTVLFPAAGTALRLALTGVLLQRLPSVEAGGPISIARRVAGGEVPLSAPWQSGGYGAHRLELAAKLRDEERASQQSAEGVRQQESSGRRDEGRVGEGGDTRGARGGRRVAVHPPLKGRNKSYGLVA